MLSCGKIIKYFSKITRNNSYLKQTSKFTEIRGINGIRFASDKKSSTESSEKRNSDILSKSTSKLNSGECEIKRSHKPLPEICEEICGKIPPPPSSSSSSSSSDKTFTEKHWKKLLAALLITGATVYAFTQTDFLIDETKSKKNKKKKEVDKEKIKEKIRYPNNSISIPPEVPYLLIGGGTAAFSAFRSIKSKDPKAKVLVISDEYTHPYMRPPLSKELWYNPDIKSIDLEFNQWNGTKRSIYYEPPEFYSTVENLMSSDKGGVAVATGWKVNKIDPYNKVATLEDGYEIKYDKCLIATGGSPKNLDIFKNLDNDDIKNKVLTFRTKDDYLQLKERLNNPNVNNIVIIGGGFLGSELACALARNLENTKKKIYQVYKENHIMSQILPQYLSQWTTKRSINQGVIPVSNSEVKNFHYNNGQFKLLLNNGNELPADQVIVAIGIDANIELAEPSSLEVEPNIGGFLVNAELEARRDLWVAGDAACFYDVRLGRRRVEHHDHAVISGRLAGDNMTGAGKPYLHQSMYWSDLGPDVGYEAIGIIDSTLPTVGIFAKIDEKSDSTSEKSLKSSENTQVEIKTEMKPKIVSQNHENTKNTEDDYGKGIIFYLRNDTVVGIVLWNIFNRMSIARQVLKRGTHVDELNEIAKLFSLYED